MEKIIKNRYKLITIAILVMMFILMCIFSEKECFWTDELDWTIDILEKSNNIGDVLKTLLKTGYNLPLYYLAMFPIYKIAPYGELWLLLPGMIMTLFGVFMVGQVGKKIGGKDLGIISLCLAATSYIAIYQGAFEFRPYAFMFCFSATTLYTYICKMQDPKNKKINILYTLSIILLAYSHWFGCLLVAFYFIVDCILLIRKKNSIGFILPYIALGITFIPWFVLMMTKHTNNLEKYWGETPTIKSLYKAIYYLLSNNLVCMVLFISAIFIGMIYIFCKPKNKDKQKKFIMLTISSICWSLLTVFIYSRYINPKGSLWVERYFLVILPQIILLISIPIAELLHLEFKANNKKVDLKINNLEINRKLLVLTSTSIIIVIAIMNYNTLYKSLTSYRQPYREMANIVAKDERSHDEDTILIVNNGKAFLTYYFQKQGYEIPQNVALINQSSTKVGLQQMINKGKDVGYKGTSVESLYQYNTIYLFGKNIPNQLKEIINNKFKVEKEYKELGLCTYVKEESVQ